MTGTRRILWVATTLLAILTKCPLLCDAQVTDCYTVASSTTINLDCYMSQADIDSGCAVPGEIGECGYIDGTLYACLGDADPSVTGCLDGCSCVSGVCVSHGPPVAICQVEDEVEDPGTGGDPHMIGLQGQKIDWKGQDGAWYALLAEPKEDIQISVRLTAPLSAEFPDRQLLTAVAIKYEGGHSVVIETKNPYTVETDGCPDEFNGPCLAEHSLRFTVDGEEQMLVPADHAPLLGGAFITASNLPTECQPYGGDLIWANTFADMAEHRSLEERESMSLDEWVMSWSTTTAAPSWCETFIAANGIGGLLEYRGKHAVFKIEAPSLTVRLHHGTNHQGGEVLEDGRVLPELEFWQMDIHLEWFDLNTDYLTGILGETIHPVLDASGLPIMSGAEALRGEVEDYHISGPLQSDFPGFHV